MKRADVLQKLGYAVPSNKTKRVILLTDLKNEADDQFAVIQHLLTPSHDVKGIVAVHFEFIARMVERMKNVTPAKAQLKGANAESENQADAAVALAMLTPRGESMQRSYDEGALLLKLAEIDDVPLLHGSRFEISDRNNLPTSEGADFIITEAMKDDARPLFVCMLGCVTDLVIAYLKKPEIADRLTAVWIGGRPYPEGGREFNLMQDVVAANILFESQITLWQVPMNAYNMVEISFAELMYEVKPCGAIGEYLAKQMMNLYQKLSSTPGDFPSSESWSLGDNPTVSVLLQGTGRICWHQEKAPHVNEDCTYTQESDSREIRVYDNVDARMTLNDLFAKLKLCYKTS